MSRMNLDMQVLRRYDEQALLALYKCIEGYWGKKLSQDEVLNIYDKGIILVFSGNGFNTTSELNYALFFQKASLGYPVIVTVRCVTAVGASHAEVIHSEGSGRLLVAGTLFYGRFSSLSTTWHTYVQDQPGFRSLGMYMNQLVLSQYNIEESTYRDIQSFESA